MEEQTGLSFSFDLKGIDRSALLTQAALELDARVGHLGSKEGKPGGTPEGDFVRSLIEDIAEFDKKSTLYPYKITEQDFTASKAPVPVPFLKLAQDFNFYQLRIPFNLWPRRDWGFNYLSMQVVMDAPGDLQPAVHQILPAKKFQNLINLQGNFEVQLGENFEFEVSSPSIVIPTQIPGVGASARAGVVAKVNSDASMVIGPFEFHWRKSQIDHDGIGTRKVFWRIEGAEFFQEDDLNLLVIVKVPKSVKDLSVNAQMVAGRYFNLANSSLQRAVKQLPEALRVFFQNGAPIEDKQTWNLILS